MSHGLERSVIEAALDARTIFAQECSCQEQRRECVSVSEFDRSIDLQESSSDRQ